MRYVKITGIICLVFSILSGSVANAEADRLITLLKSGGYFLMIRHAQAPGSGDPENFKIGDCSTQRNLNETGRAQARSIGNWLRHKGLASARVYASQWCRCLETAKLMGLGPVKELPALNSFYERIQDREPNISALKEVMWVMKGGMVVSFSPEYERLVGKRPWSPFREQHYVAAVA